jgi:thiol-disulfide isomerase/thioredoxin
MRFIKIIPVLLLVSVVAWGQTKAPMVKLTELQQLINTPGEEIRVINFWATWCAPCIKELPLFGKY